MFASASKRLLTKYTATAARQLSVSAVRRNVIQDLYLRELKNVKVAPISAESAEGSVRPWIEPKQAKVPESELSGAAEALKAYEEQEVETVEAAAKGVTDVEEGDWLVLDEAEEDHHHGH